MAEVKMDLAELKQLEQKIENLEKEKQELIDRQHQVVVHHKYFNGKIKLAEKKIFDQHKVDIQAIKWSNNYSANYIIDNNVNFQSLLDKGLIEIDISEISSKTTKDYINMSEAIEQIRKEEKENVKSQLQELINRAYDAEVALETSKEDSKKEILRIKKIAKNSEEELINNFNSKIDSLFKEKEKLIKEFNIKYKQLEQQFEDFKEDKKRLSLEEQIIELKNQLEKEKSKTIWQRIFNK